MYRLLLCIALLCALAGTAPAEENTEAAAEKPAVEKESIFSYIAPRLKEADKKRWFYTLSGWYERKTGNTNTLRANGQTELLFSDTIAEFLISGRAFYGENRHEMNEDKRDGIIKYDRYLLPRLEFFTFSQSEYNKPARLAYRNNSGMGLKLVFVNNFFWKIDLSGAPLYQYEDFEDKDRTQQMRWSVRYRIHVTPVENVVYDFVCFYIPRVDDPEAYRFNLETVLKIKMATNLSFNAGYIYQYNRNAFPGTQRVDDTFYTQLSLNL